MLESQVDINVSGLVGNGFTSHYQFQPRAIFFKDPVGRFKAITPSSLSVTTNNLTNNLLPHCPRQASQTAVMCGQNCVLEP